MSHDEICVGTSDPERSEIPDDAYEKKPEDEEDLIE